MGKDFKGLADLLAQLLVLRPKDEENHDLFYDLIARYNEAGVHSEADMATFVDVQLSDSFHFDGTDDNFCMGAQFDKHWVSFLEQSKLVDPRSFDLAVKFIESLASLSIVNKQKLGQLSRIKSTFVELLLTTENNQVQESLARFYALVLSVSATPNTLIELYQNFTSRAIYNVLNILAVQLSDPYTGDYFQMENCYSLHRLPQPAVSQCSFMFYLQLNNVNTNRLMTIGKDLYLEIKLGKMAISNDEYIIAIFDDFEYIESAFYTIVLTINGNQSTLYVNGDCVNTVSLVEGCVPRIDSIEVGSLICSFKLFRFYAFNACLLESSIKLLDRVGAAYKRKHYYGEDCLGIRAAFGDSLLEELSIIMGLSYVEYLAQIKQLDEKNLMIDLNPFVKLASIPSNGTFRLDTIDQDFIDGGGIGKCYYYKSTNLAALFFSINCFQLILSHLEECRNMDEVLECLTHLIKLLGHYELRHWFEEEYGYRLLADILINKIVKKFQRALPIQFLNLFLGFCGWNLVDITESLIQNHVAYGSLVLTMGLWYCDSGSTKESREEIEILRFLLFQIVNLMENSKHNKYNSQKLKQLNLLHRVCHYFHLLGASKLFKNIMNELRDDLPSMYKSLLSYDLTIKNVQWLLHYAYFELKSRYYQNSSAILESVDKSYQEILERDAAKDLSCLTDAISVKFMMVLIQEHVSVKQDPSKCLRILCKIFLTKKGAYSSFVDSSGLPLLLNLLKEAELTNYRKIISILFAYSVGNFRTELEVITGDDKLYEKSSVVLGGLLKMAIDLIQWALIGGEVADSKMEFSFFMKSFFKHLGKMSLNQRNSSLLYPKESSLPLSIIDVMALLQPEAKYSDVFQEIVLIFARSASESIIKMKPSDFENYIESFYKIDQHRNSISACQSAFFFNNCAASIFRLVSKKLDDDSGLKQPKVLLNIFTLLRHMKCGSQSLPVIFFNIFLCLLHFTDKKYARKLHPRDIEYSTVIKQLQKAVVTVIYMEVFQEQALPEDLLKSFHQSICDNKHIFFETELAEEGCGALLGYYVHICIIHYVDTPLKQLLNDPNVKKVKNSSSVSSSSGYEYELRKRSESMVDIRKIGVPSPTTEGTVNEQIKKRMDETYRDDQKLLVLFREDNEEFQKNLAKVTAKYFSNFITDLNEDSMLHDSRYRDMLFRYIQTHQLWGISEYSHFLWSLDSLENSERARNRLLPLIDASVFGLSRGNDLNVASKGLLEGGEGSDFDYAIKPNENRKVLRILQEGDAVNEIWNCSLIIGLEILEGVLLFGKLKLYFISGYHFLKEQNKVINISEIPTNLRDPNISVITGDESALHKKVSHHVFSWYLDKMTSLVKRPFLLRDIALEFLFENGKNCLFGFRNKSLRDSVYSKLDKIEKSKSIDPVLASTLSEINKDSSTIGLRNGISKVSLKVKFMNKFSNAHYIEKFEATELWERGIISNFNYLMVLNTLAGRSFNDLTQYPIFPWVLSDYDSPILELHDYHNYRDLSKPMGAQSEKRRKEFMARYEALEALEDAEMPPFHYGTHYSSAMIVSSYLIRLKPFVDSFLLLQDGSFGHADRLFSSLGRAWASAAMENTTDVRELTPEFFFLPHFLKNLNNYDFGVSQSGQIVNDVELPPWAKDDPIIFITKHRQALESEYVSQHLHEWIDLIFGYKQRGEAAVSAVNVFNRLSYPGAVNLDKIDDTNEKRAIVGIIHNFGQTPLQLFEAPHPQRRFFSNCRIPNSFWNECLKEKPSRSFTVDESKILEGDLIFMKCGAITSNILWLDNLVAGGAVEAYGFKNLAVSSNFDFQIDDQIFHFVHIAPITSLLLTKVALFATGDETGVIKVWKFQSKSVESQVILFGHLVAIKAMDIHYDYSTLVSLDKAGHIYLWDLLTGKIIRRLSIDGSQFALSQDSGTLCVKTGSTKITFADMNGGVYFEKNLKLEKTITSMRYCNFASAELGVYRHIYWEHRDILLLGFSDGSVEVYTFRLSGCSQWELVLTKRLLTGCGDSVTCLEGMVRVDSIDGSKVKVAIEIAAVGSAGRLYNWKPKSFQL